VETQLISETIFWLAIVLRREITLVLAAAGNNGALLT